MADKITYVCEDCDTEIFDADHADAHEESTGHAVMSGIVDDDAEAGR